MSAMRVRGVLLFPAMGLVGVLAGCAMGPKPLYYWGNYQRVMYQMQAKPGSLDNAAAIDKLSANIDKATAAGLAVPPGEHADLGYLQYQAGDLTQAAAQFRTEESLYPSSRALMNRLLAKISPGDASGSGNASGAGARSRPGLDKSGATS